jgi:hypothetical protein
VIGKLVFVILFEEGGFTKEARFSVVIQFELGTKKEYAEGVG